MLQDAFSGTATSAFADLLLPATTWGEKSGTVTNSERRITRVRAALPPHGEARADWAIAAGFGRRLERGLAALGMERRRDPATGSLFDWPDVEAVWNEHRELTRGRDLDITGLSYALLERRGPQQWPMPAGARRGVARLYTDRRFATGDGRAHFHVVGRGGPAERTDEAFPVALLTGRLRDQWHGMSRTGLVGQLFGHEPEPVVELAAADFDAGGWRDGDLARVTSRRGAQVLPVRRSDGLRPGTAFVGMHWGPAFVAGGGVNALTLPAVDPVSRQPELKHCAVRIEPAQLAHRMAAFGRVDGERVVTARRELLALARHLPFAASVPFGRDDEGVLLRVASDRPFDGGWIAAVEAAFGVADAPLVTLDEPREARRRHVLLAAGRLRFVLLAGDDLESEPWLRELLLQRTDAAALGARLLRSGATAPLAIERRGRNVCNCVGVSEAEIRRALGAAGGDRAERIEAARSRTGCGSQCGACLAEVGRLADDCLRALHPPDTTTA